MYALVRMTGTASVKSLDFLINFDTTRDRVDSAAATLRSRRCGASAISAALCVQREIIDAGLFTEHDRDNTDTHTTTCT